VSISEGRLLDVRHLLESGHLKENLRIMHSIKEKSKQKETMHK